ncbi:hypothetical protein WJX81_007156 [Elliptochloris bilobata]|uniref:Uncharacterized protein n=1 Tax=Elliptochloris bilobata TaxID=381761 RepID=A0AAW1S4Y3_9CHLO
MQFRVRLLVHTRQAQQFAHSVLCRRASASPSDSSGDRELYGPFATRRQALVLPRRSEPCRRCGGTQELSCAQCGGAGRLSRGGYHRNNPVNSARIVGTKWTARQRTLGWRHFHAVQQLREEGGEKYVLLVSTCDNQTKLWLNAGQEIEF